MPGGLKYRRRSEDNKCHCDDLSLMPLFAAQGPTRWIESSTKYRGAKRKPNAITPFQNLLAESDSACVIDPKKSLSATCKFLHTLSLAIPRALVFSQTWHVHRSNDLCVQAFAHVESQSALRATFKSIKSVVPLFDRVLVQRYKPQTVSPVSFTYPSIPVFNTRLLFSFLTSYFTHSFSIAANCNWHLPPFLHCERTYARSDRHCCWPRSTKQGWSDCPH